MGNPEAAIHRHRYLRIVKGEYGPSTSPEGVYIAEREVVKDLEWLRRALINFSEFNVAADNFLRSDYLGPLSREQYAYILRIGIRSVRRSFSTVFRENMLGLGISDVELDRLEILCSGVINKSKKARKRKKIKDIGSKFHIHNA